MCCRLEAAVLFHSMDPRKALKLPLEPVPAKVELIILALSENWDLNKYPIFAQNWACVGASCLDHLFLPIFP